MLLNYFLQYMCNILYHKENNYRSVEHLLKLYKNVQKKKNFK